jgi:hypothetical protein
MFSCDEVLPPVLPPVLPYKASDMPVLHLSLLYLIDVNITRSSMDIILSLDTQFICQPYQSLSRLTRSQPRGNRSKMREVIGDAAFPIRDDGFTTGPITNTSQRP